MYPEAGGSSSFARRAFNEFWSFFAAWAQMLTYVATIAISAFFVPHYLGGAVLGRAAPLARATSSSRAIMIAILGAINIVGVKESTGVNVLLAVVDFLTQVLLVIVGAVLVFSPADRWSTTSTRRRADVEGLRPRDPDRHARLHGHRDVSNMSEEAKDESHDDPGGDRPRAARRVRDLLHAARGRARPRCRCTARRRRVPDAARPARGAGRLRRRPGRSAWSRSSTSAPLQQPAEIYVGLLAATILFLATNAGPDRHLAARLLDGHPPPDARRAAATAPALPHAVDRDHRLLRLRDPGHAARPGDVPRQRLLVRRAAVVHDGARRR